MIKKFLIETKIVTNCKDVIDNTLDYLSVDVDECSIIESEIIELFNCPNCGKKEIREGYNYCPICSQLLTETPAKPYSRGYILAKDKAQQFKNEKRSNKLDDILQKAKKIILD